MLHKTELDFFKNAESFLTELTDLESEYVRGGGSKKGRRRSPTCQTRKSPRRD